MTEKELLPTAFHEIPADVEKTLKSNEKLRNKWNAITPLARNEWICWITSVRKKATRQEHIVRMREELLEGKKRPCCWPGCPHRKKSADKWFK